MMCGLSCDVWRFVPLVCCSLVCAVVGHFVVAVSCLLVGACRAVWFIVLFVVLIVMLWIVWSCGLYVWSRVVCSLSLCVAMCCSLIAVGG